MDKRIVISQEPSQATSPGKRIVVNRFIPESESAAIRAWKMIKDNKIYQAYQLTMLHGKLTMLRYEDYTPIPPLSEFWRLFEIEDNAKE